MKQEVYKPSYLFLSRLISFFIAPFFIFIKKNNKKPPFNSDDIKTILISEYQRIGDFIISAPYINDLKVFYPNAKIIVLVCEGGRGLAREILNVSEVIECKIPWVNNNFNLDSLRKFRQFYLFLRGKHIDLSFDFKGDFRNNLFLWLINSNIRIGYKATGGSYFLTHAYDFPFLKHQSDRAAKLFKNIGINRQSHISSIAKNENGKIVLHPGASSNDRVWPSEKWISLIKKLPNLDIVVLVKTRESLNICTEIINEFNKIEVFEGSLLEFNEWLKSQKILIGMDSMSGHLAAYHNLITITIFGRQNPNLTKPKSKNGVVVLPSVICSHYKKHWRICWECIDSISANKVYEKLALFIK
tara:strand:+ start:1103 stop:2173 length:1071 start_codon:yes stop_codon:yes gene_type:complete